MLRMLRVGVLATEYCRALRKRFDGGSQEGDGVGSMATVGLGWRAERRDNDDTNASNLVNVLVDIGIWISTRLKLTIAHTRLVGSV